MSIRKLLNWKTLFIYTHRWTGIVFGIIFVVWFISGVAMMYVGMPHLSEKERLGHLKPLDLSHRNGQSGASRRDVRPLRGPSPCGNVLRWAAHATVSGGATIYADTGELTAGGKRSASDRFRAPLAPSSTQRRCATTGIWRTPTSGRSTTSSARRCHCTACRWATPRERSTTSPEDTGEPTMKTDRRGRVWGYIGAVLHWTYFTSLRRNGPLWQQLVAWGAIAGAVMCVLGMVVGIVRLRVTRRYRLRSGPSYSPYAGWMKWHHYAGLIFGVVTITWAFSGAMSLGQPFPNLRNRPQTDAQRTAVARHAAGSRAADPRSNARRPGGHGSNIPSKRARRAAVQRTSPISLAIGRRRRTRTRKRWEPTRNATSHGASI